MSETSIFAVGGTVQASNGLYIPRRADDELLALCRGGNFAYVLTPRQLGKSSLMVRTAEQLTAEGMRSVIIDLSQIGVQVTAEEWYLGLLTMIEEQLELDTDAVSWWQQRAHMGITQKLTRFFEEVLLKEVTAPVVIFVDEIDTTLSLNFTDDFFAAIRYFYNARALSQDVRRLSFVLIGVATPGDLIRDPQRTPFNIGQRVDLTDFTLEEALPFAAGLGLAEQEARRVLGWVMKWTGGHPYLTQRLCRALTDDGRRNWSEADIDAMVGKTFLGRISEEDNNLQFVRDMLTKRAPDLSEVLYTYREVLRHRRPVLDEEQSLIKSHLKLSGVAQRKHGELTVRNPLYAQVFNEAWVKEHLPVNWFKRARRAGIPLAFALLLFAAAVAGFSAVKSRSNLQNVTVQKEQAEVRFKEAVRENELAKQRFAAADKKLNEAEQAMLVANSRLNDTERRRIQAAEALTQQRTLAETRRQQTLQQLQLAGAAKIEAERSAAAARAAEQDATRLRDEAEKQSRASALDRDIAQGQHQMSVARQLADQGEQQLRLGNAPAAELLITRALTLDDRPQMRATLLEALMRSTRSISEPTLVNPLPSFSHGNKQLALVRVDGSIELRDSETGQVMITLPLPGQVFPKRIVFSPDDKQLAVEYRDGTISLFDTSTGESLVKKYKVEGELIGFYPATQRLIQLIQAIDQTLIESVDSDTGDNKRTIQVDSPKVSCTSDIDDGRLWAAGRIDGSIELFEVDTGQKLRTLTGHSSPVQALTFTRDRKALASIANGEIRLWDIGTGKASWILTQSGLTKSYNNYLSFSPEGKMLATVSNNGFEIWDTDLRKHVQTLPFPSNNGAIVDKIILGPEGKLLVAREANGTTRIWNVESGEVLTAFYDDGVIVGFSSSGRRLYSSSNLRTTAWEVNVRKAGKLLVGHTESIVGLKFDSQRGPLSRDRSATRFLASNGLDRTIKIWDIESGAEVQSFVGPQSQFSLAHFDSQRQRLVTFEANPAAKKDPSIYRLWDTRTGREVAALPLTGSFNSLFYFSPNGRFLATSNQLGSPGLVRDIETGKELINTGSISTDTSAVGKLWAFSGDSRHFAVVAAEGGILRIWDIETGSEERLTGQYDVRQLVLSFDATRLAVVRGTSIDIYDMTTKKLLRTMANVTAFAGDFSANGRLFGSVVGSGIIKIWEVETGNLPQTLLPGTSVYHFSFSPDAEWLISYGLETRLWHLRADNPDTGFILPENCELSSDGRWIAYKENNRIRIMDFEKVKHVVTEEHWALLKEVKAGTNRRVGGLDFNFLPQIQIRDILGNSNPEYALVSLANLRQDEERDKQAELRENSFNKQPTHRGSISGTISFEGQPPVPRPIDSSADSFCGVVNPNLSTEDWIVADGKLANVFVYVKSGTRLANYTFDTPTWEVVVGRKNCQTTPHLIGLQTNQVLKLVNDDRTTHNYHFAPKANPDWNQSLPPGGGPLYHRFNRPEIIPLKCNQHPWERGYIGVFSNPFFAISAKNGTYTITGLPPGQYTIVAWHEGGANGSEQSFEVTIDQGESMTQNFTFSKP